MPQIVISYLSVDAYTRSLETIYDNQVSQLIVQAAQQTATKAQHLIEDLERQATQPHLQLSFQQYQQSTRLRLLRERLELFRRSHGGFTRLDLCDLRGKQLVSSSIDADAPLYQPFEKETIATIDMENPQPIFRLHADADLLAIFLPVHSFRQATRTVGFLVAYLPLNTLTVFLEKLDLGEYARKSILRGEDHLIEAMGADRDLGAYVNIRHYAAPVRPLSWQVVVDIPEDDLFRDVVSLKRRNAVFIGIIILVAAGASIILSQRFTRPFKKIISGTRIFAKGNLDYRISVQSGHEARQMADAFNEMAGRLNQRQMQLNQAVRLASLGVMTAGIGHEIKNPLAGIKTSAQVIDRLLAGGGAEAVDPAMAEELGQAAELAQEISNEADRLTKILNDLLEFGRPRKPRKKPFDIADTIAHAANLVQPEYLKKRVALIIAVDAGEVVADSDQILQVFLNLLLNGLQAVDADQGRVEVAAVADPDQAVRIEISDNGSGIPEEKLPHVFDPFFSLREDGTGLGLSVVYTLLQQNDASLTITSQKGHGTRCTLVFTGRGH
jgi:signal transduction histidine kinase